MNDLINRDEAIQRFIKEARNSRSNSIHINTIKRILQDIDIAYSIKKVIKELEQHYNDGSVICGLTYNDAIKKAIEIVKAGGKNEN